jgi:hypothetical protein
MALPASKDVRGLLLALRTDELAHSTIGARGRRVTSFLLGAAAVLGAIAGASGLAGLNQTAVGVLSLVSAGIIALMIWALTTLKFGEHLRAAGEYDALYLRVFDCDPSAADGDEAFDKVWAAYKDTAAGVDRSGARLTPGQLERYEPRARRMLPEEMQADAVRAALPSDGVGE